MSYCTPGLRSWDVISHHVVLLLVASLAASQMPGWWCYFYFGVVEIVSPPLGVYDQLERTCDIASSTKHPSLPLLARARDFTKILAALVFTVNRAMMFTFVTFFRFLPDASSVRRLAPSSLVVDLCAFAAVGFAGLQIWWFRMLVMEARGRGGREEYEARTGRK